MRDHAVGGTQARGLGFVVSQQNFTHFDKCKIILAQGLQDFLHLIEGRHQATEESAGLERRADLRDVVVRIRHVEEERVGVGFVEALRDVAQFEVDARGEPEAFDILDGEILRIGFDLVRDDASLVADSIRERGRHRAGAGTGFHHFLTGSHAHRHKDEADVFRVHDLRGARQVGEQVCERGLQEEERRAEVTEHLCAPCLADQVVVLQDAAMRFELCASLEGEDEMFVPQADELDQVAVAHGGYVSVEGHEVILSRLILLGLTQNLKTKPRITRISANF